MMELFIFVLSGGYIEYAIIRTHLSNHLRICILLYVIYTSVNPLLSKKGSLVIEV